MPRIAVYFDGGPFTDAVRGLGMSMDMDYTAFLQKVAPDAEIAGVHFVLAEYPEHPYPAKHRNEKLRLEEMRRQGVEVHLTKTQVIGSVFIDRGVESVLTARLILDAQAGAFDTALIISRRAELSTAIAAVRAMGKSVEIAFFQFTLDPVNPLDAVADRSKTIALEEVIECRRSGHRPPIV